MNNFVCLSSEEMLEIDGDSVKDVVTTGVGVCGAIAGGLGGFVWGYAAAGNVFTGPVSVGVGVVCAGAAGTLGYSAGKEAAENTWNAVASIFK